MVKQQPWRSHQSVAMPIENPGRCAYKRCPALLKSIGDGTDRGNRCRGAKTKYRCEECSIKAGVSVWLCNKAVKIGPKKYKQEHCHMKHHSVAKNIGNGDGDSSTCSSSSSCSGVEEPPDD